MKTTSLLIVVLAACTTPAFAAADERVQLDPFAVKANRIEDFGFDLWLGPPETKGGPPVWRVHFVVPHTAAAKAGLEPGDRVRQLDGKPVTFRSWNDWVRERKRKRDAVAKGGSVRWILQVQCDGAPDVRTRTLTVPTLPPHWGGSTWRTPEGQLTARLSEAGPLAELAQTVLDNGVGAHFAWPFQQAKNAPQATGANPPRSLAFTWTIFDEDGRPHKIAVSAARGRTDIVLAVGTSCAGGNYLTSPTGVLDDAVVWPDGKTRVAQEAARGFRTEIEFWTRKVGSVSPRWPLELRPADPGATKRP
jgi:hypothetical protein